MERPEPPRRWSLPLGRVAGVQIRLHLTFVALVLLVAWSAVAVGGDVVGAVGWLLLLFSCVVIHELAHSLVARARGIDVHEIDLLPIGGVSRMEHIPERWADEAAIAVAGPLASVALAVSAAAVAGLLGVPLLPVAPWSGAIVARLVWMNLLLASFNMVPAFPLDGGRVLRALLERDRPRVVATRQAAQVGRVVAALLIAVGVTVDVWLALIGAFIWWAGRAEEASVVVHDALGPVPAGSLAIPCPVALPAEACVGSVAATVDAAPQVAYPVVDAGGTAAGLVPLSALRAAPPAALVGSLAISGSVPATGSVEDAGPDLDRAGLVAVRDASGRLVGVLTAAVVADFLRQRLTTG